MSPSVSSTTPMEVNFSKGRETGSSSSPWTTHPQIVGPHTLPCGAPGTFAYFLMDAVLTHLWTVLAHPLHGHVPLGAGFPARPVVQDEASFTRVAVGGIPFTCSAGRATTFTSTIFCIEAPVGRRGSPWRSFPTRAVIHTWQLRIRTENGRIMAIVDQNESIRIPGEVW